MPIDQIVFDEFDANLGNFEARKDGEITARSIDRFVSLDGKIRDVGSKKTLNDAARMVDWAARLPVEVAEAHAADLPLIDLALLPPDEAALALQSGVEVLGGLAEALVLGTGDLTNNFTGREPFLIAFGDNPASRRLRDGLVKPFGPPETLPPGFQLPDLSEILIGGALANYFAKLGLCGMAAAAIRDSVRKIGIVTEIDRNPACGGEQVTISYINFGPKPTGASYQIDVRVPTSNGSAYVRIPRDDPLWTNWKDEGSVTILLPVNSVNGKLGFRLIDESVGDGGCAAGSILSAAGEIASVMAQFGGVRGFYRGQQLLHTAAMIESLTRNGSIEDKLQIDGDTLLRSGAPEILSFAVTESGPIHPRGTVTLIWEIRNADRWSVRAEDHEDTPEHHQLPPVELIEMSGRIVLPVPCDRPWRGRYVLSAENGNGCGGTPPRTIDLYSGWTEYRVGVARKDITVTMGVGEMDVAKRVGMAGFAYEGQRAHSVDPDTTGGVAKRNGHFARAFIMTRNSLNSNEAAVIVVCDLWIISQAVKREVAARLATQSWAQRYTADRIMLCATHTHAGVGGYSEYYLYNMTIGGFIPEAFDQIVEGIVDSILEAHRSLAPGQVLVNEGPLGGCGMIRSMDPFRANAESNLQEFAGQDPVDPKPMMTLLRFQRLDGAHQGWTDIGSINWYALHPTSLGVYNTAVSGDNKGWAALRLEEKMLARPGHGADYVAGFANGAAGDVSGNVGPGQGIPMGGPKKPAELAKDRQRMKDLGELQCDHALQLILGAVEEMTGPLDVRYDHVDMSMVTIQGTNDRTWPATLGVSFGAGSSEDGEPLISEGSDMKSAIPEGVDQTMYAAEAVVAIATAVTLVLEVAALISLPVSILGLSARLARLFAEGYGAYKSIWIQANIAYIGLSFKDMPARDPQDPLDKLYDWKIEAPVLLPWAMTQGQNSKPIMLPVGVTWVEPRVGPKRRTEVPMVPHVAPLQLLRLGQLALIGVPAEFTQIAARRLTDGMQAALAPLGINRLAVAGYTNAYSGYVTTPQEYQVQHYEGASTLYGPHTLAAYRQEFGRLAASLAAGTALPASAPAIVPVISFR